jgi:hypothetical protein
MSKTFKKGIRLVRLSPLICPLFQRTLNDNETYIQLTNLERKWQVRRKTIELQCDTVICNMNYGMQYTGDMMLNE